MSDEMLIRVRATYDGYGECCELQQETVTIEKLLSEQSEYMLEVNGFVMVDTKKGISKKTASLLRKLGWVHVETAKKREEKKVMEAEYYLYDQHGNDSQFYNPRFSKIDVENLTYDQTQQLAKGGKIVQVVSPESVLPTAQMKQVKVKKTELEDAKTRAKVAAETRAAKKRQQELERAKKLLQEAGETV